MEILDIMLRTIASSLQYPVIGLQIVLAAVTVVLLGTLVAEYFLERRRFKVQLPHLVDDLEKKEDTVAVIVMSGLLDRQKRGLLELTRHPEIPDLSRESLAADIDTQEQCRYDNRVRTTDFISKIAPMLGLMGTLIPLGPGLIALGQGDTQTLSESLLTAFDTTILGLAIAAVAMLISTIRKAWYVKYMSAFDASLECLLEKAKGGRVFDQHRVPAAGEGASDSDEDEQSAYETMSAAGEDVHD